MKLAASNTPQQLRWAVLSGRRKIPWSICWREQEHVCYCGNAFQAEGIAQSIHIT